MRCEQAGDIAHLTTPFGIHCLDGDDQHRRKGCALGNCENNNFSDLILGNVVGDKVHVREELAASARLTQEEEGDFNCQQPLPVVAAS